jgi:hypothetical protein
MARVQVRGIKEATAAAAALKAVDRQTRTQTGRALRSAVPSIWTEQLIQGMTRTRMDRAAFAGVRVRATGSGKITLEAGTRPRIPADITHAYEFGDPRKTYETYRRKGRQVRRRTQQQLPGPIRKGRVAYPALAKVMPRIVSLYVQTVVRTIHESWGGK